jgi:hypothetical protein
MPQATLRQFFGRQKYFAVSVGLRPGIQVSTKPPLPPPEWPGTRPEWSIYWAHTVLGLKEPQDFEYRYNIEAGFMVSGLTQIDFYDRDVEVLIEIQGLFWHYQGLDGFKIANDLDRKQAIEAIGYQLIYIDEDNANEDPVYYLREARSGRDHSRAARFAI